jgi:hypothetical protein
MNTGKLEELAKLIAKRNVICTEIARIVDRPAFDSHIAAYIASEIFSIELHVSASNKGFDGRFRNGNLAGRSVNVKWKGKGDRILNLSPDDSASDFYLVLAGAAAAPGSSLGQDRPFLLEKVYCFDAAVLLKQLRERGVKIGIAGSVAGEFWRAAEVFPSCRNNLLIMSDDQRKALSLFTRKGMGV